ncbi:MAG: 50S ribosomal protein L21 [Chloroflexi bacterium]|nr:50S ribosomal protein L21 [Chloroflexota bacterium]
MYAIVESGGKQYRVAPGHTIEVDLLKVEDGDTVELDRVLLIADGDRVVVGAPMVKGAKVLATSQGQEKGDKIVVFKFKSKVRYRRKGGHRAVYTRLMIDKIVEPEVAEVGA